MKRYRRWIYLGLLSLSLVVGVSLAIAIHDRFHPIPLLKMDDLRFSMNPESQYNLSVPPSIAKLDGKVVEIVGDPIGYDYGFINNQFEITDWSRLNSEMLPPLEQEFVRVTMKSGHPPNSYMDPMLVRGTLHVKVEKDSSGRIVSLYRLDCDLATTPPMPPQTLTDATLTIATKLVRSIVLWICFFGIFAASSLWFKRKRAMRRIHTIMEKRCLACGYDLRATPDRCPECGTAVSSTMHA